MKILILTVCGGANESCPAFMGAVRHREHIGFDDPSHATGTPDIIAGEFRRVRDENWQTLFEYYTEHIINQQ